MISDNKDKQLLVKQINRKFKTQNKKEYLLNTIQNQKFYNKLFDINYKLKLFFYQIFDFNNGF